MPTYQPDDLPDLMPGDHTQAVIDKLRRRRSGLVPVLPLHRGCSHFGRKV